jgi:hypothetical protein
MSARTDIFSIKILSPESLKEYLERKKHPCLVAAILHFIETHFSVKIGDLVEVTLEFEDYHGYDCHISVTHFVPIKMQVHDRLLWKKEKTG